MSEWSVVKWLPAYQSQNVVSAAGQIQARGLCTLPVDGTGALLEQERQHLKSGEPGISHQVKTNLLGKRGVEMEKQSSCLKTNSLY